jgi:hypothetical protein
MVHPSGFVKAQTTRHWDTWNSHMKHEIQFHDQDVGVWCAANGRRTIGPFLTIWWTRSFTWTAFSYRSFKCSLKETSNMSISSRTTQEPTDHDSLWWSLVKFFGDRRLVRQISAREIFTRRKTWSNKYKCRKIHALKRLSRIKLGVHYAILHKESCSECPEFPSSMSTVLWCEWTPLSAVYLKYRWVRLNVNVTLIRKLIRFVERSLLMQWLWLGKVALWSPVKVRVTYFCFPLYNINTLKNNNQDPRTYRISSMRSIWLKVCPTL